MTSYETFAQVYDSIMDRDLYQAWLDFSLRHFPKGKKRVLELACGTGLLSILLAQQGYEVTGLDLSSDMLKVAEQRSQEAGQEIAFTQGNMLDLSQAGTYELVTCYSDSICYMEDEVDVGQVFEQVYGALESGGRFLFDVHSTYQIDEVFPGYAFHENAEDYAFVWDSYSDAPPHSIVHELTFFIQEADGRFSRHDEVHEERTYELITYEVLLEQAGFVNVQIFADFEDQAPGAESARWFFVAEKP